MREMANVLQKYKNKSVTPNAAEDAERQEFSLMVDGNSEWYSHFGDTLAAYLASYSLVFTQRSWKLMSTQKLAHGRL